MDNKNKNFKSSTLVSTATSAETLALEELLKSIKDTELELPSLLEIEMLMRPSGYDN